MTKAITTVSINSDIKKKAKRQGINMSQVLETALKRKLKPTVDQLKDERDFLHEEYQMKINELEAKIEAVREEKERRLRKGKAPQGQVKILKEDSSEKERWKCPECGVRNPLIDRKCIRCKYSLSMDEWQFVKKHRKNDSPEKDAKTPTAES